MIHDRKEPVGDLLSFPNAYQLSLSASLTSLRGELWQPVTTKYEENCPLYVTKTVDFSRRSSSSSMSLRNCQHLSVIITSTSGFQPNVIISSSRCLIGSLFPHHSFFFRSEVLFYSRIFARKDHFFVSACSIRPSSFYLVILPMHPMIFVVIDKHILCRVSISEQAHHQH